MKIIVTGGAGFIGSHLVDALIKRGHEVHVLDNLTTGQLKNLNPKAIPHFVDICKGRAKELIIEVKPEVVYHLAAQADVGRSVTNPSFDAEVNINGTINILEACSELSVKKLIFASTSAVYGNLETDLLKEEDITAPTSYYGLSKLTAESYIRMFNELYALPYTILRYANVYGPRQIPKGEGGVVAVFLDRLARGRSLTIHGDGEQTRDLIYVKDVVEANLAALKLGNGQTLHVSTSQRTSINDMVKRLETLHHQPIKTIRAIGRIGDIKHSCLDNRKAMQFLNWSPKIDILDGLSKTYTSFFPGDEEY